MSWLFSQALVEAYSEGISLDGEQSAQLSGTPMPQAYLCSDKMMGFSRLSRFGMTFRILTEDRGEALLMSYLEGFPARTSVQQERGLESTESNQACGEKWQGSFAKYDPDTHSLRTHQCSLLEDLTESCQTLPAWGLMRDGECWEQPTLVLRIKGTESGLWRTPQAADAKSSIVQKGYATNLTHQVMKWPTPTARIWKGGGRQMIRSDGKSREDMLDWLVEKDGGRLNPTWVEWLMGWPLEWTDLKPLETDKFQQWQQQHGNS
jgi:hypothetical protein